MVLRPWLMIGGQLVKFSSPIGLFDLVIFDEASQCPPNYSIRSISWAACRSLVTQTTSADHVLQNPSILKLKTKT
jgi:hypothetical protein